MKGVLRLKPSQSLGLSDIGAAITYGQDRIDTRATPTMIAALTRKAMRKDVKSPPHIIPSHIYKQVRTKHD